MRFTFLQLDSAAVPLSFYAESLLLTAVSLYCIFMKCKLATALRSLLKSDDKADKALKSALVFAYRAHLCKKMQ